MDLRPPVTRKQVFSDYYCPVEAGYKDRSGVLPYDKAACRALESNYRKPKDVTGSEERTLFVGRLPHEAEEADLEKAFGRYGEIQETRLIRDLVTGAPRGYGFVVFVRRRDAVAARAACRRLCIAGADVVVEAEFSRGMRNWKPRRLGGGLGGKKEAGQLRFGGVARPFQVVVSDSAGPGPGRLRRADRADTAAGGADEEHHSESTCHRRHRDGAAGSDRRRQPPEGASEQESTSRHHSDERRRREESRSSDDKHQDGRRDKHEDKHRDKPGDRHKQKHRDRHKDRRDGEDGDKDREGHRDRHKDDRSDSGARRDRRRGSGSGSGRTSNRGTEGHGEKPGDGHSGKHGSRHKSRRDREEVEDGGRHSSKKRHRDRR